MSGYPIGPEPEEIRAQEAGTMIERNAAEDLNVCEAATPGPWWAEPADLKDGVKAWFICFTDLGKQANAEKIIISVTRRDGVAFDKRDGRLLATGMMVPVNPETEKEDEANAAFFAMAREALPYWIREAQEEREARERAEKALENIRGMCSDNGEFQGGGISDLDELSNEHRYMSQTIYRIASNALKTKAQAQEVKADE